ncbi:LysM peptidoglycan-binding domain-containing protein [Desulfocastanea catecholica]
MRAAQRIHLVYFLSLITALVCAGCVPQPKTVTDVAPAPTTEHPVEEYSDSAYAAGDEVYPAGYYIHTVSVPNENISIIAKWYTGSQKNWVVLAECNPTIKPNRIFLGDKIKIPRSLMTRQTELPAKFVHQTYSRVKKKKTAKAPVRQVQTKTQAAPPAAEEQPTKPAKEEPLFFGPKGY